MGQFSRVSVAIVTDSCETSSHKFVLMLKDNRLNHLRLPLDEKPSFEHPICKCLVVTSVT